jgi:hypothetical protein
LKKYAPAVLLLVILGVIARPYIYPTEKTRIKKVVHKGRAALEQENRSVLKGLLAPDFRDRNGNDREMIMNDVELFFNDCDSIEVAVKIGAVRVRRDAIPPTALCSLRTRVFARIEGEKGIVFGGIRPADVVLTLVKKEKEWLVTGLGY